MRAPHRVGDITLSVTSAFATVRRSRGSAYRRRAAGRMSGSGVGPATT